MHDCSYSITNALELLQSCTKPSISLFVFYVTPLYNNEWWSSDTLLWNTRTYLCYVVNTLRPRQNGRHFADDTFKRIFLNENVGISIKISLKFIAKGSINNIPALVQIMAWRRPGDKSLSEAMMVRLLTHICVARPQWVNTNTISDLVS